VKVAHTWWSETTGIRLVHIEAVVLALVTVWLSALGLEFSYKAIGTSHFILFAIFVIAGIGVLAYSQPTLTAFAGVAFFGIFIAGGCGIVAFFDSPYPWWFHGALVLIGLAGAGLLYTERLEELLEAD
jgi:hypothetical protein